MKQVILEVKKISKSFSRIAVLQDISMCIEKGSVVTLVGENGAGKSTLCKIIAGIYEPDEGKIVLEEREYSKISVEEAKKAGIRMVHQELLVLPKMTIMENIFVGDEVKKGVVLDKREMESRTRKLLEMVGLEFAPDTKVAKLDIAARQLIEIARALNGNAKVIILDEPTSSLSDSEIDKLFSIINRLKMQGVSFLFISHRMKEILEISDEVVVLRDGALVKVLKGSQTSETEIVKLMVGRDYDNYYHRERSCFGGEALRVEEMTGIDKGGIRSAYTPENVSFTLHEGEVLGLAGLVGAGRTELVRLLFGEDVCKHGKIYVKGKRADIKNCKAAMGLGMAWLTEDRKNEGLILKFPVVDNMVLPNLKRITRHGLVQKKKALDVYETFVRMLKIKVTEPEQKVMYLSGGNQQKVILAKWLAGEPDILVLDEPTRGIDVGAKAEIYKLINELTAKGIAILLISSELPEIMGMSDRILVMYEGKISAEIQREEFSEERIMAAAVGRGYEGGK
ncbi:xylose import ATP-binding protein XylG [Lachnospiraceae bacterium]|nr:xylose import ATP-binding protein XylG [Lachnospiraceae bacterium]